MPTTDAHGRPNYPIEDARLARLRAEDGLRIGLAYLDEPRAMDRRDQGHDLSDLRKQVSDVIDELVNLRESLHGSYASAVPAEALAVFDRADAAFGALITRTFMEEQDPRLHVPQDEFRAANGGARKQPPGSPT